MQILSFINIDVVEIIIVYTRFYKTFKELKNMISKLNDVQRVKRINDKLTVARILYKDKYLYIDYKLDGRSHREYDKPSYISMKNIAYVIYKFKYYGEHKRINKQYTTYHLPLTNIPFMGLAYNNCNEFYKQNSRGYGRSFTFLKTEIRKGYTDWIHSFDFYI